MAAQSWRRSTKIIFLAPLLVDSFICRLNCKMRDNTVMKIWIWFTGSLWPIHSGTMDHQPGAAPLLDSRIRRTPFVKAFLHSILLPSVPMFTYPCFAKSYIIRCDGSPPFASWNWNFHSWAHCGMRTGKRLSEILPTSPAWSDLIGYSFFTKRSRRHARRPIGNLRASGTAPLIRKSCQHNLRISQVIDSQGIIAKGFSGAEFWTTQPSPAARLKLWKVNFQGLQNRRETVSH